MRRKHKCPVKGCKPENHDPCLCGHHRMDHLEIPAEKGGGCWATGTDCWPRCLTFEHAVDEDEPQLFFEAWAEEFGMTERPNQEEADAFRAKWISARGVAG